MFLSDLGLPGQLKDVAIRLLCCYDQLEKLYYSLHKEPICINCCIETDVVVEKGFLHGVQDARINLQ